MTRLDLYARLPIPVKGLAVAAKGAFEHAVRYGRTYRETLAMLPASERWTDAQVGAYRVAPTRSGLRCGFRAIT